MEKQPWWKGSKGEWYVVGQFALLGWLLLAPRNLPGWASWPAPWNSMAEMVGGILLVVGLTIAFWGVRSLGKNITAVPKPKNSSQFVETGAYRVVRHPIYSGIILGCLGFALFVNGVLTLFYALLVFLFFDRKSRLEERWLTQRYPMYESYQNRVRKLIPFVY